MNVMPTPTTLSANKDRGFTLIELLVTITIIAILSAIGLVAYATVSQQGRDSKRKSDLLALQSALEQYYSDMGNYPCSGTSCAGSGFDGLDIYLNRTPSPSFTNRVGDPGPVNETRTYMNTLAKDPSDTDGTRRYRYEAVPSSPTACSNSSSSRCTSYCLYAHLENFPASAALPTLPAGCSMITLSRSGYNFVVTPP